MPIDGNTDNFTDYYMADVISYCDYTPYGMVMESGGDNDYRYSFQGQEKDDEIKGEGNSINYTYRMHDPRVGRFFAVDPLAAKYPHNSPYAFSENRVIDALELEGLEMTDAKEVLKNETAVAYLTKVGEEMVSNLNQSNFIRVNINGQNVGGLVVEEVGNDVGQRAIVYRVGYITPNGAEMTVDYPIVEVVNLSSEPGVDYVDVGKPTSLISEDECGGYYTNCHGEVFGTQGILRGYDVMLNIIALDYKSLTNVNGPQDLEVGDVLVYGDHSIAVSGVNDNGELLYTTNMLGQDAELIDVTWDVASSTLGEGGIWIHEVDGEGNTTSREAEPQDFEWFRPKE